MSKKADTSGTTSKKTTREKPLSLHPLTMDEALRIAMEVPPPKDEKKHKTTTKK